MAFIYFYPKSNLNLNEFCNPYTINFEKSLSKNHIIVNSSTDGKGVLNLLKYLLKSEIFLFNWIEDIPARRFGKLQVPIFVLFVFMSKILRKKIVWILHNKGSHEDKNNYWKNYMFSLMMKHSHLIITHSQDGIEFSRKRYTRYSSKVKFLMHPVTELIPVEAESTKKYDILLWGVILPYKGIVPFLNFITKSDEPSLKILIVGKCLDKEYKKQLNKYISKNIIHLDEYYDLNEISKFASQSKYTLFTYLSDSVLSSGALIDSIRMGSNIIGPNFGGFKDLSSFSFMNTYDTYTEILQIIKKNNSVAKKNSHEIQNFCYENSWNLFIDRFDNELIKIL